MSSPNHQQRVAQLAQAAPKKMGRHELASLARDKAKAIMRQARRDKMTKLFDAIGAINLNCCEDKLSMTADSKDRQGQIQSHLAEVDFLPDSRKMTFFKHRAMLALLGPDRFCEAFAKRLVDEFIHIEADLIRRGRLASPKITTQ